jgi:hypothetical protein
MLARGVHQQHCQGWLLLSSHQAEPMCELPTRVFVLEVWALRTSGAKIPSALTELACVCPVVLQEDLSETTPAVEPLCRVLLADPQPQEVQQHIPQIVEVSALAGQDWVAAAIAVGCAISAAGCAARSCLC